MNKIGFMQGRLSPIIDKKIQCFPWKYWKNEFVKANSIGFDLIEWTLDQENLYKNPIMNCEGRKVIRELCIKYSIRIISLTGDCFMQAPFWKKREKEMENLKSDFLSIIGSCSMLGIKYVIVPLVDEGSISNAEEEYKLINFLSEHSNTFKKLNVQILFESDYDPDQLNKFINLLDNEIFGINYDTGNSAALGYNVKQEIALYGAKIKNIHIKDRLLNGRTVALGSGVTNFIDVFKELKKIKYKGNFILQTARALDDNHEKVILIYKDFTSNLIKQFLGK